MIFDLLCSHATSNLSYAKAVILLLRAYAVITDAEPADAKVFSV